MKIFLKYLWSLLTCNNGNINFWKNTKTQQLYFISFGPVSVYPQRAHSWVAELQSQNIGRRNTRLCHSNLFNALRYIPCIWFLPVAAYHSSYPPSLPSSPSSAAAAAVAALAPNRSNPFCSHHLLETHAPGLRTVLLKRSRIGRVTMYCTTEFYIFQTYATIYSNPASYIAISAVVNPTPHPSFSAVASP